MLNGLYEGSEIRGASSYDAAADMIRHNIANSDRWLTRAIVSLFERQTTDEQTGENTRHLNGRGFGALDAGILSSFAKQIQQWQDTPPNRRRFASPLSPKQREIARRLVTKYCRQLARIARPQRQAQPA